MEAQVIMKKVQVGVVKNKVWRRDVVGDSTVFVVFD